MSDVSNLRAAFLEQMSKTLGEWSETKSIYRMDGQFTTRIGWDGRTLYEFPKLIYHFTPEQWKDEEVQKDVTRLKELSKLIQQESGKKSHKDFLLPHIAENLRFITISCSNGHSSKQFQRLEVLENLKNLRDVANTDAQKSRFSEMIGAVNAVRDPVLRGRRVIPTWTAHLVEGVGSGKDLDAVRIRRLKYGIVHIGQEQPEIFTSLPRKSRTTPAYQVEPIAAYTDELTTTPWQFWPEDPERIVIPDFG